MKLSGFNKFFFDIITENNDYLIIYVSILKAGSCYYSILQSQCSVPGPSGNYLSRFNVKTKIRFVNASENEISFAEGKIYIGPQSIKFNLLTSALGIDLVYENISHPSTLLNDMEFRISGHNMLTWEPLHIKSNVSGCIKHDTGTITIIDSPGYTDLVKIKKIPLKIPARRLFWGRLHSEDIDLTFSLIINKDNSTNSKLFLRMDNQIMEFSNLDLYIQEESASSGLSIIYPGRYSINARNGTCKISMEIYDQNAMIYNEFMDVNDQAGQLLSALVRYISHDPKGIKFMAKADIILKNNLIIKEFHSLHLISEYVCFDWVL